MSAALVFLAAGCGGSSATPTAAPVQSPTPPPYVPGKLGVSVLPSSGPHTLSKKMPVITLHLVVRGLHLDARHMGGKPVAGHGHVQVYLDRIPADAYTRMDLKGVVANVATPLFSVGFPPGVLKKEAGHHRFLVALARYNGVLYRVKAAAIPVTFK